MVQLILDETPVGYLKAKEASIRPRSIFALVTLMEEGAMRKLRLDLGKSVFIDHVDLHAGVKINELPAQDVIELTRKIINELKSEKYAEDYNKPPAALHVVQAPAPMMP